MSKQCEEHQAPTGEYNRVDYAEKMNDLIFRYDKDFYPEDSTLPDPQVDPVIPGTRTTLDKVGIGPVDLPIQVWRRDDIDPQTLQATASLYCSLDDPNAKGLNLSRLYLLMHETISDKLSIEGIKNTLKEMANKQGANNAYCKLRFKYPWTQKALRSRKPRKHLTTEDFKENRTVPSLSSEKLEGHIAYNVTLEGRYHSDPDQAREYRFYLTVEYVYSSTCPCSFELAHHATRTRGVAANAHSQRSRMETTIEFDPDNIVWIEDLVELHRQHIPTEVQVVVKRRDEQAFAELNGANLLFSEDAVRIMYAALDEWYTQGRIHDFLILTNHEESLHPWNAIALKRKGIIGGLR